MSTVNKNQQLLKLDYDVISKILSLVSLNPRLVCQKFKKVSNIYKLSNKTFIFESLNVFKFSLQNGYLFNKNTCKYAAMFGQ